jgi:flagella basal body P-ring formation protein FlgA
VSVAIKSAAVIGAGEAGDAAGSSGSRDILLSDIADIDPPTSPEGGRIGQVVVAKFDASAGFVTISVSHAREAMDKAGVSWAKTTLRGSSCRVTSGAAGPVAASPEPLTTKAAPSSAVPQPMDVADAGTVRGAIAERLAGLYGVAMEDLRLAFDTPDEAFLSQATTNGQGTRRVDVQPTSGGASARTPVNVFIYDGDRLTQTRLVSTRALVNRAVVTARAPIMRSQPISPDMVEASRQWLAPNAKPSATPDQVVGQVASRPIATGAVVTSADITAPVVCKRGDIIWVHVLSGGMSVKAKARAMAQARDGERVQLKLDGSDRTFTARMSGPGRAVMVTDDAPDAPAGPQDSSGIPSASSAPGGTDASGADGANREVQIGNIRAVKGPAKDRSRPKGK